MFGLGAQAIGEGYTDYAQVGVMCTCGWLNDAGRGMEQVRAMQDRVYEVCAYRAGLARGLARRGVQV